MLNRLAFLSSIFWLTLFSDLTYAEQSAELIHGIQPLRDTHGNWQVTTEFLNEDGTVARSVTGSYQFSWVVEDRVLSGTTSIPALQQTSSILFYINEKKQYIEMVSVGGDGMLWTMTGPLGGEERISQVFPTANGGTAQLKFTRFNVSANQFESKMQYSDDGGKTWKPGNHQRFIRAQ